MQKWEQKQRQKAHELKIQNAKSAIKKYSKSKEKTPNSGRVKNSSASKVTITPINKILQIFQMQRYAPLLAKYDFPTSLTEKKTLGYLDDMLQQVAQKDKQKFLTLLNTLSIMSKDVKRQSITPKSTSVKSVCKPKKPYLPPQPSCSNSKATPNSIQKSQKTAVKFRVKQKSGLHGGVQYRNNLMKMASNLQNSRQTNKTRDASIQTGPKVRKSISYFQKSSDDSNFVHQFNLSDNNNTSGIVRTIKQGNKILNRLLQKLQIMDPSSPLHTPSSQDLKLDMQRIKNMYLSFDSATLTSNIINIDLHQMIQCLALQVKCLMDEAQINNLARRNADQIKQLLHQSFVLAKSESRKSRQENSSPEKDIRLTHQNISQNESDLLESPPVKNGSIKKFHEMRQIDIYDDQNQHIQDQIDTDKSSQEFDMDQQFEQNTSIDMQKVMKQSSIWGNSYIGSVINDFTCFDNIYESAYGEPPMQEDIKNFIQLVVMAGRMQKQVPIIAYVYLKRLLTSPNVKGGRITSKNWKNLMLVTLIQASKIWDDQSLQNHSFAKLIKPYTTLQINRLEKYLVYFLDYRLTIQQKQYSESYFKLRKHIGQKQMTQGANLMRLDLKTIQKLQQSGIYGTGDSTPKRNQMEKKQFLKRLLNKSF